MYHTLQVWNTIPLHKSSYEPLPEGGLFRSLPVDSRKDYTKRMPEPEGLAKGFLRDSCVPVR